MPVIISATSVQVTLSYTGSVFDSGGGATVLGFATGTVWGTTQMSDFATLVGQTWDDFISTGTSDQVTLASVRVVGALNAQEVAVGAVGTVTTDTTPPNTALLVNYITPRRGRRGRGRSFLPGMTFENTTNDDGTLDSAWRTSQQARVDGFFEELETTGEVTQVVLQNSEGDSTPINPAPAVVTRVVDGKVSTQRRRLRR